MPGKHPSRLRSWLTRPGATPLDDRLSFPCPCDVFTAYHPNQQDARSTPFLEVSDAPGSWYSFPAAAQKTVRSLQPFDAAANVLVCIAHDPGLERVLDFFPHGTINEWQAKGWKEATSWGFLNELPVDGKPGRPMITDGLYKDGRKVGGGADVLRKLS